MTMKDMFLNAIISGDIGKRDNDGIIIELQEFKSFFKDTVKSDYISSFLASATIEKGQHSISHTRYLFRIKRGVYRVHADAILNQIKLNLKKESEKENKKKYKFLSLLPECFIQST